MKHDHFVVQSPDKPAKQLLLLFHGVGDNAVNMGQIGSWFAPVFPQAVFVVMGMNYTAVRKRGGAQPGNNVVFTGPQLEDLKEAVMALAEVAIAPMASGTGSSLKIPDYVAHGKVVIGTAIGMRGFTELTHYSSVMVTDDTLAGDSA